MSGGSGGYAVSKTRGGDRFYSPPAVRRQQQILQQEKLQRQHQQQQLPRPVKSAAAAPTKAVVEAENRTDSDESTSTLSKPPSVCSSSPPRLPSNATNLDRLMESVTPFVRAQYQANSKGRRTPEYYSLEDLWETFREWSVYGAGVPLLLNGEDSIMQYYVPYLSGIQLYADPAKASKLRRPGEESDVESLRETSSGGSSDYEADRSLMNVNSQRLKRLSLRDKSVISSSSEEAEITTSPGTLVFEYLEHEPPHNRKPLTDKVSFLANQFPDLRKYRSCDLSPSSWICVAWYPIYRIPMGSTLKDLDASFLSFHSLSTSKGTGGQPGLQGTSGRTVHSVGDASMKIPVPAFGLASYKLKGSILTPSGPHECQQENFLLQAADNWLQRLQAFLPDYQFFRSHYSQWRQWGDEVPSSNNCVAPARGKKFEVSIGVNSVAS